MGFEPTTSSLGSWHSTTELRPHDGNILPGLTPIASSRSEPGQLGLKDGAGQNFLVDDIVGNLSTGGPEHAFGHGSACRLPDIARGRRPVWRQDDVVQTDQGVIGRQGFDGEYI